VILSQHEEFTLANIVAQAPAASQQPVKKVLAELKCAGKIRLIGRGRGARRRIVA
jgi:hypothetical protein